uniref:Uncharacterized protein n=1 Tax=Rhodosorus marinus TaxID=101924 RepID=A0A7S0BF83_9RHOD|mmetsp:Transcript_13955/g.20270  ORF Transcript_13955/g.20270 Transcript_13955/m.20270 type:complete len:151 (+) Transcript_13955:471-923(+)
MLPSLGARLQLTKCSLYGRSLTTTRLVNRDIPGVQVTREGVTIHSIPIGTRQYIEQECRRLQNQHEHLFKEISRLPQDALAVQLALYRYRTETRLDYTLRSLAYPFGRALARSADIMTRYHLEVLFGGLSSTAVGEDPFVQPVDEQILLP